MTWLDRTSFTAMAPSAGTMCRSMAVAVRYTANAKAIKHAAELLISNY